MSGRDPGSFHMRHSANLIGWRAYIGCRAFSKSSGSQSSFFIASGYIAVIKLSSLPASGAHRSVDNSPRHRQAVDQNCVLSRSRLPL